ncbi:MAG: sugar phosphate isomerase/epimerase [Planctomycetes bacterium]|nr:sugar phosphate isomerase/epimerase [Planctomycetota bacterium]
MPKLSINEMTTYRWSFDEDVLHYRELGIEGMGVWRWKIAQFGEERGVELLRESGLNVSNLSWGGGFTGADGRTYKESVEDAIDGLHLAADLGAEVFVVVSGPRGGHTYNHARDLLIDALWELVPVARQCGVAIGLEPMHPMYARAWTFLVSLDDAMRVLDTVGEPELGLVFDIYHLWQEKGLLERIPVIAPQVRIIQLADWHEPPRSENDRVMPGNGVIPLKQVVQAFQQAGYDGYYDLELLSEELWRGDYLQLIRTCRQSFAQLCE